MSSAQLESQPSISVTTQRTPDFLVEQGFSESMLQNSGLLQYKRILRNPLILLSQSETQNMQAHYPMYVPPTAEAIEDMQAHMIHRLERKMVYEPTGWVQRPMVPQVLPRLISLQTHDQEDFLPPSRENVTDRFLQEDFYLSHHNPRYLVGRPFSDRATDPTRSQLYYGYDLKLREFVLMKIGEDPQRTLREARALAQMDNGYTVKIRDISVMKDSLNRWTPVMIMDYLESYTDLHTFAHEFFNREDHELKRLFTPESFCNLIDQIASALEVFERSSTRNGTDPSNRFEMRDVKLGNVMFNTELIKFIDFGIATWVYEPDDQIIAGTPEYMSPRQVIKEQLTERDDLFTLGIMAFELLTGENPFYYGEEFVSYLSSLYWNFSKQNSDNPYLKIAKAKITGHDISPVIAKDCYFVPYLSISGYFDKERREALWKCFLYAFGDANNVHDSKHPREFARRLREVLTE